MRIPQDAEAQKYAARVLRLSFPCPTCARDCALSRRCVACHSMEEDEKRKVLFARCTSLWKHWKAYMSMRSFLAEERILAGLPAPVIRDIASVRPDVTACDGDSGAFWCLCKLFREAKGIDCRRRDTLRLCERVAWLQSCQCLFATLSWLRKNFYPVCRELGWSASSSIGLRVGANAVIARQSAML